MLGSIFSRKIYQLIFLIRIMSIIISKEGETLPKILKNRKSLAMEWYMKKHVLNVEELNVNDELHRNKTALGFEPIY